MGTEGERELAAASPSRSPANVPDAEIAGGAAQLLPGVVPPALGPGVAAVIGNHAMVRLLQRSAGNAAVGRLPRTGSRRRDLQRAIVAIHAFDDQPPARRNTEAALELLSTRKVGGHPIDEDAPRGKVATIDLQKAELDWDLRMRKAPPWFLENDQTLYILGHGGYPRDWRRLPTLAGMTPKGLAIRLRRWFGEVKWSGRIKLVACISANTSLPEYSEEGKQTRTIELAAPFAKALAEELRPQADDVWRPRSVDGLLGIGWVTGEGRQMTIGTDEYVRLASAPGGTKLLFALFGQADPVKRDADIKARFGAAAVVGKQHKQRFPVPPS